MANSFAPVQLLRTDWNPDIWTAFDNGQDDRTNFAVTMAPTGTPTDKNKFAVMCILIQQNQKLIYVNTGTTDVPVWTQFGPGTNIPTPLIPGQYLTNDGTTAFWGLVNLATGVTGVLDITHLNMAEIEAYLLADNTFLSTLATDISSTGNLSVHVDGTSITGNGTSASPLVAHSGGSSGIVSINGNTTSAQVIAAGTGVTVVSSGGTTTITNTSPGSSGLSAPGREYTFSTGSTTSFLPQTVHFGSYLLENGLVFGTDANTNAMIAVSNSIDFQHGVSVSEDGLTLYTLGIVLNNSGFTSNQAIVTLKAYDQTLTLTSTSTGTFTLGFNNVFRITDANTTNGNQQTRTFFVKSGHLVMTCLGLAASFGADWYCTDLTVSGTSLTTLTATNLKVATATGPTNVAVFAMALPLSGSIYMQEGNQGSSAGSNVYRYTYSALTFSSVLATNVTSIPSIGPIVAGFKPISTTLIGRWRNTSINSGSITAIYDNYTF